MYVMLDLHYDFTGIREKNAMKHCIELCLFVVAEETFMNILQL